MEKNRLDAPLLNKHIGLIHCEGKLSLLQRKICNILLFNALSDINAKDIFEINLKHLCSLIGYKSNDTLLIKNALKGLISLVLEWNLLERKLVNNNEVLAFEVETKSNISWNASSLLAGVSIEEGRVSYSYSPQIKKVISSLDVYGRINLFVQAKFKSTYSLALYENCIRFKNIKQTCWFGLGVFRELMGIEVNKYTSFKELNRNVIQEALKEINLKSDIYLEVEQKKLGRVIVALKFYINENTAYLPKLKRKHKKLSESELSVKNILLRTFKLNESDTLYIIERYDLNIVKIKLDEIYRSNVYKNNKIYNAFAYINAILEASNCLKDTKNTIACKEELDKETVEEPKAFNHQYIKYKTKLLIEALNSLNIIDKKALLERFMNYLKEKKSFLVKFFQQTQFDSPMVLNEFIQWLTIEDPDLLPQFWSYEEFIIQDEVF